MLLLQAENIKKSYGDRLILEIDHLEIQSGEKIGLVGPNGSGKTTLMNILAGTVEADEGSCQRNTDISFIHQFSADNDIRLQNHLSGGEKTKAVLLAAFNAEKPLCFADEPTNHLDMDGIRLLEKRILSYPGALLLISHDRELLDQICSRIIAIENTRVISYRGNYQSYLLNKQRAKEHAEFNYLKYQQEKQRLQQAMAESRQKTSSMRKAPKRMGNSEARLHKRESGEIQKKLARSTKALQSRIDRLQEPEQPVVRHKELFYTNPLGQPGAKMVVRCDQITLRAGDRILIEAGNFSLPKGSCTALTGANGTGKTSLLKLLAAGDQRFKIAPGVRVGYLAQELENLDPTLTVLETVKEISIQTETTARTMLAKLLFQADAMNKKAAILSGGEKVKLALSRLLLSNANLLLLDEPNNYLDINSTEALQQLLTDYPGTILFVSHDRQLIRKTAQRIIHIAEHKLITFEDGYEQYEKWREKQNARFPEGKTRQESELLLLKMRCAELAARIAKPRKNDDIKRLEEEYQQLVALLNQNSERLVK